MGTSLLESVVAVGKTQSKVNMNAFGNNLVIFYFSRGNVACAAQFAKTRTSVSGPCNLCP